MIWSIVVLEMGQLGSIVMDVVVVLDFSGIYIPLGKYVQLIYFTLFDDATEVQTSIGNGSLFGRQDKRL